LTDTPVTLLNGARQTGKSTLVQGLSAYGHQARYITLDNATDLAAASADPEGFIEALSGPVILDEVQHVPGLFPAIKREVDRNRVPGRFLLTGSADVLLLPNISESLAGRMEIHTLWPFSAGELEGRRESFIDKLFSDAPLPTHERSQSRDALLERIRCGGYPEIMTRSNPKRRDAWFGAYTTTILQRDLRDMAEIEHLTAMPRLLALLAARMTTSLNYSEIARSIGLPYSTIKRYMALLETAFMIQLLPPWSANFGKRLVKSPRILIADTGLAWHLLGAPQTDAGWEHPMIGPLLENFVVMEIRKQCAWNDQFAQMFYVRTQTNQEIDLLLEDRRGRVVGIEVKAAASSSAGDFKHLRHIAGLLGKRFLRGIVLYTGERTVAFSPQFIAMPVTALWA
jgi:uncharacterized protein